MVMMRSTALLFLFWSAAIAASSHGGSSSSSSCRRNSNAAQSQIFDSSEQPVGFKPRLASVVSATVNNDNIRGRTSKRRITVGGDTLNVRNEAHRSVRGGAVYNGLLQALAGTVVFAAIEKTVKASLQAAKVQYPSQLGACILLFFVMVATDAVAPAAANRMFTFLSPGAALLAKWFPVFFVPGLAMLPLSPPIGGTLDILKIVVTVIVGFVYSMTTTLVSVTTVRRLQGRSSSAPPVQIAAPRGTAAVAVVVPPPFSPDQWNFGVKATLLTGVISLVATKSNSNLASPLQMIFTLFATVTSYIWGTRLPTAFVKLVHPLVTSSVMVLGLIRGLAVVTGRDFRTVLATYKVGSLNPLHAGAGDYLLYVLGPGVVAFAVSVFGRRSLLFRNLPMVLTAMLVSSAGGLFATGVFVRLIQLGGASGAASSLVRLSVLARNVTMALAMALTDMIGGDVSIVAMVVCLTGIVGATYGVPLLDAMGIRDPICRGLGIGSSAQGLGVAAIAGEPDAFAFASVAMILTAVAATTLVSLPVVRSALIQATTGQVV